MARSLRDASFMHAAAVLAIIPTTAHNREELYASEHVTENRNCAIDVTPDHGETIISGAVC